MKLECTNRRFVLHCALIADENFDGSLSVKKLGKLALSEEYVEEACVDSILAGCCYKA